MSEADIQALLEGIAAELGVPVALDDTEFRLLAYTAHDDAIDEARRSSILGRRVKPEVRAWVESWGIRAATAPIRTPADPALGILARWCVPVRFRGLPLGYIWILDTHGIAEEELHGAVEAANQVGALVYRRRLLTQIDNDLLRLLLIPNPDNESAAADARADGTYTHNGPVAVIVVDTVGGGTSDEASTNDLGLVVQRAVEQTSSETILAGALSGLGVLLAPVRKHNDLGPARSLAAKVRQLADVGPGLEVIAAIGGVTELPNASHSYGEAKRALRMLHAMPNLGPIVAWDDLGAFRALAFLPREDIESGVLDPRVRQLISNEELAATAETFLDHAGNVQQTAANLYLHRTTLYQRLDRIAAVYGLDLRRSGEHRLVTHLGLKLARAATLWPVSLGQTRESR